MKWLAIFLALVVSACVHSEEHERDDTSLPAKSAEPSTTTPAPVIRPVYELPSGAPSLFDQELQRKDAQAPY